MTSLEEIWGQDALLREYYLEFRTSVPCHFLNFLLQLKFRFDLNLTLNIAPR